jgi:bifunctional aspartokinase / homoserine dehydrogenase 1
VPGLIGVPGTASRLFEALRNTGVSVVLISQGSSEHSICFAVPEERRRSGRAPRSRGLRRGDRHGPGGRGGLVPDCSILAVVGEGMRGLPGVAAKLFGALGRAA